MGFVHMAADERRDLLNLTRDLSDDQWDTVTLCDRWSVRDVVAHVISYDTAGYRGLAKRLVKARLNMDRANDLGVDQFRHVATSELVDLLARNLKPTGPMALMGGVVALTDTLIHHQDIRRPLGLMRTVPEDRLRVALRGALFEPTILGVRRTVGISLIATDIDWTFGRGAALYGTGEELLMTLAGRHIPSVLHGPGLSVLVRRDNRFRR